MKRNLLSLFAIGLAIAISSFGTKRATTYFLVYKGTGSQKITSSYNTPTTTEPSHVNGTGILNWLRVIDQDNNGVSDAELANDFETYDVVNTSSNTLNDETVDVQDQMDIKTGL